MSSSDDGQQSPEFGASNSKLESKDQLPPLDSEHMDTDDYSTPEIKKYVSGVPVKAENDRSGRAQPANKIMKDSLLMKLPWHIDYPADEGLWKQIRSWHIDGGKTCEVV